VTFGPFFIKKFFKLIHDTLLYNPKKLQGFSIFFSLLFSFHHSFMKFQYFSSGSTKNSQFFRKGSDRGTEAQRTYQLDFRDPAPITHLGTITEYEFTRIFSNPNWVP